MILWFVLLRMRIISPHIAIGLHLITCGLSVWLFPYHMTAKLQKPAAKSTNDDSALNNRP